MLTLACAGSGKSRTLAYRIAWLIAQRNDPRGIVAFTFTDKAADSIKLRVAHALQACGLPPTVLGAMYIGTIHGYCHRVLGEMDARYRQFDVLDENRLKLYLMSRYGQLGLHQLHAQRGVRYFDVVREVADAWRIMNDEMVDLDVVAAQDPRLGSALADLRNNLDQDEFIDFSLMIRLAVEGLCAGDAGAHRVVDRLTHLMVDEYQDVNPSQEALIQVLHRHSATLFVVGDDDQAVYAWRGADVSNILTFQQRYDRAVDHTLSHNFRSTPAIVSSAERLAAAELGATRIPKHPTADEPPGPRQFCNVWFPTRDQEAEWVAGRIVALLGTEYRELGGQVRGLTPGDFAVLMRSTRAPERAGSPRHAAFTHALDARGIRYTLEAGGGVFERPQVRVLRDTFELLRNGSPDRTEARNHFDASVLPSFPAASFDAFARVLAEWGRLIHGPIAGARRRVYPQQLVHDLLSAFRLSHNHIDPATMRDIGIFSRMIQDVEAVYLSIDTTQRFQQILNFLQNVAETGYDTATEDVLRRPDAVTVSTVHRVKGLEFPAVFVVDVEAQRFPGNPRPYRGWLPPQAIQHALNRGAYHGTRDEEARLFYTALTRSERYLYVTAAETLPGGKRARTPSPFSQRLTHPELCTTPDLLPPGLMSHQPIPRIDEAVMPTTYSDIRYYLRCPRDYQFRKSFGFSPAIPEMFGFGMTVHTAVSKLHEQFPTTTPTPDECEALTRQVFHLKHVPPSHDPVERAGAYERAQDSAVAMTTSYVQAYATDFTHQRQVEVHFEVPITQAVIAGSIDLLLTLDPDDNIVDAKVIDFKAMEGGQAPQEDERLHWTELALQVQLYAKAARDVLHENARTGAVHLLKDNRRVDVPVDDNAVQAAVANVEWAVDRILAGDFPMRPHTTKCAGCDFRKLCPQTPEQFATDDRPPPIHLPPEGRTEPARAFSQFDA